LEETAMRDLVEKHGGTWQSLSQGGNGDVDLDGGVTSVRK
jgi:hypothetical protein